MDTIAPFCFHNLVVKIFPDKNGDEGGKNQDYNQILKCSISIREFVMWFIIRIFHGANLCAVFTGTEKSHVTKALQHEFMLV